MATETSLRPVFLHFPGGRFIVLGEIDQTLVQAGANDPEVRMYLNRYQPEHLESTREWFASHSKQRDRHLILGIEVEHEGRPLLIGTMGLHSIHPKNGTATTGTLLWDTRFWNRGIGTNAKMALLHHAFYTLNLRQIYSDVIAYNGRSARYAEKCGYRQIAHHPEDHYWDGRYHDVLTFMVTRVAWEPLWKAFCAQHRIESLEDTLTRHQRVNRGG